VGVSAHNAGAGSAVVSGYTANANGLQLSVAAVSTGTVTIAP
jgi:hypothetical protein